MTKYATFNDAVQAANDDQMIGISSADDSVSFDPVSFREVIEAINGNGTGMVFILPNDPGEQFASDVPKTRMFPKLWASAEDIQTESPYPLACNWDGATSLVFPPALIKGLLSKNSIGFLAGESTAGKTFVAVYMAYAVALGRPFFGQKTKRGGVLYVAAEGGGTILHRMEVARMMMDPPEIEEGCLYTPPNPLPIVTIKDSVPDLAEPAGLKKLIETAVRVNSEMERRFGVTLQLVIIDTALAAFGIDDWNSPSEVTKITTAMNKIREATGGASVIGVAHHGKDVTRGISGSFASKANADTILSVMKVDDDNVLSGRVKERTVLLTKFRDGEAGFQHGFEIEGHRIGTDEDGDPVYSGAVKPVEGGGSRIGAGKGLIGKKDNDSRGLKIFKDAYNEVSINTGQMVRVHGDGPEVRAVCRKDLSTEFKKRYTTDEEGEASYPAKQKAFTRAFKDAVDRWNIHEGAWSDAEWIWRVEPKEVGREFKVA